MITVHDVSKRYGEGPDAVQALEDIDVEINTGEFVSVVGPSGCGKSTLLNLVSGLIGPTSGRIEIEGVDVQSPTFDKTDIGLIFQRPILLEWRSVMKNVMLPIQIMQRNGDLAESTDYYRERADDLLELVGLDGFGDAYPGELSGGMQQRVTICQSLIFEPDVLLMDEPFGSLDALTKDHLNQQLLEIWRETGKTIIFVTHDLEEAVYLSDRVFVMSERPGRIVDTCTVPLPRPRTQEAKESDAFVETKSELYRYFR